MILGLFDCIHLYISVTDGNTQLIARKLINLRRHQRHKSTTFTFRHPSHGHFRGDIQLKRGFPRIRSIYILHRRRLWTLYQRETIYFPSQSVYNNQLCKEPITAVGG